jgi:hypothetical protein
LQKAEIFKHFKTALIDLLKNVNKKIKTVQSKPNELFLKNAIEIAPQSQCTSILLFGNIDLNNIDTEQVFNGLELLNVGHDCDSSNSIYDFHLEFHINVIPTHWIRGFKR